MCREEASTPRRKFTLGATQRPNHQLQSESLRGETLALPMSLLEMQIHGPVLEGLTLAIKS